MPIDNLPETPSQTAGPYVHIGTLPVHIGFPPRPWEPSAIITAPGEKLVLDLLILDGSGAPVKDAMVELWQADSQGRVGDHGLWARGAAEFETGQTRFETVHPGALVWRDGRIQAPHLSLLIFSRGINIHLHTRVYFPDDATALAADPLLNRIEQVHRRATLVVEAVAPGHYRHTIRLRGEAETVFLDM